MSKISLRIGGFTGFDKLLLGRLTDICEDVLPVVVYTCPQCGKLEFFTERKNQGCVCGHSREQHRNWQYNCLVENCDCSKYTW